MTDKAQEEITDYSDPIVVRQRYEATKRELALLKANSPKPTAGMTADEERLQEALGGPAGPPATLPPPKTTAPAPEVEHYVATIPMALHPTRATVDDIITLERFRLGAWVAKAVVIFMAFFLMSCFILYGYTAYETKTMPDVSILSSVFGHLKEVLVVILESNK